MRQLLRAMHTLAKYQNQWFYALLKNHQGLGHRSLGLARLNTLSGRMCVSLSFHFIGTQERLSSSSTALIVWQQTEKSGQQNFMSRKISQIYANAI